MRNGNGVDIKISTKTQIRKAVKYSGSLWELIMIKMSLGSSLLPMALPLAKKGVGPLATGA